MVATEIIRTISVILAAGSFIWGIIAWRKEFIGKRKIELAENVLTLFYQASDVINFMRSSYVHSGEGKSRKRLESETKEETELLDKANVTFERYQRHSEFFSELWAIKYRFMAVFGKEAGEPFNEFKVLVQDILSSTELLSSYYRQKQSGYIKDENTYHELLERIRKTEAVVWFMGKDNDEIGPRVRKIIGVVEKITETAFKR